MTMEVSETKLDGNAIGGLLREIFTVEMTAAETTCAECGALNAVGRVDVYMQAPGVVVRCPECKQLLILIVHARARHCAALRPSPRPDFTGPPSPPHSPTY